MLSGNYKVYTLVMIEMYWLEYVQYIVNDKDLRKYNQKDYEDMIIERYKFIVKKKKIIEENTRPVENWITSE